jgi:putative ABC transport system permease protein
MLTNFVKLAWRNLAKNALFTTLNGLGLAIGLTVALLLLLHVRDERSFDRFHTKADRIYRVLVYPQAGGGAPAPALANCPNSVGPVLRENVAAVEQAARLLLHNFGEPAFVRAGHQRFVEAKLYWSDAALLDIFDLKLLTGDRASALQRPYTVLLSRSTALRYFATTAAVGQLIHIDQMEPLEVTGVYEDLPGNSTFEADLIGSFASVKWAHERLTWDNASFETWLLLQPDAAPAPVTSQIAAVLDRQIPREQRWFSLGLQPLVDVHLGSAALQNNYSSRLGDPRQVNVLAALAMAVLLIACFNYMNLATARSQLRFRDVGINKALGAQRGQLALRFLVETGVLVGLVLVLALALASLALPLFNELIDKQIALRALWQPAVLLGVLAVGAVVTLIAGAYPAAFLTAFRPKQLLQTSFRPHTGAGALRRALVVVQFALATVLISGTLVFYRQLQFIQQKKLGYEPEQVVALSVATSKDQAKRQALLEQVQSLGAVEAAAFAQTFPGRRGSGRTLLRDETDETGTSLTTCRAWPGIEDVLQLRLVAGRHLAAKAPDDTTAQVVLNRTAVAYLGCTPEQALGRRVQCQLGPAAYVVGVVDDFHAESLHQPIGAYALHDWPSEGTNFLLVRLGAHNLPETMRQLEDVMHRALPEAAFDYTFLDAHLDRLYRKEQRTARATLIFSGLAILVACLGLFGLVAFTAEQRTREIGIRKVLGASVSGLVALLSRHFLRLVATAIVLAAPVTWWLMQRWLEDFAYRIEVQWWMLLLPGLAALAVAMLTVGMQSARAALANPVKALRSE